MTITIQHTLLASPERVWQALTQAQSLSKWFAQVDEMEPIVGFNFQFWAGEPKRLIACQIVDAKAPQRLAMTWQYPNEYPHAVSQVAFELEPSVSGTTIQVTHSNLSVFPQEYPEFSPQGFKDFWTVALTQNLPAYLQSVSQA